MSWTFVRYAREVIITKSIVKKKAIHSVPGAAPEEIRIKQFSRICL